MVNKWQAYFWSRIRKNRENKYLPLRGVKQEEVPRILLHEVIIAKDVDRAEEELLKLAGIRRYMAGLRTEPEKRDFRNHLRKYVTMYLPDCPFEVSTTNRYTVTASEAAITARKRIREGDRVKYLCGTLVPLTETELRDLDLSQRNFSIVQSDRKKNTLIFLGPARFANHDCAANGRLVSVGKDGLEVHATRNIDIGEEITVTYSPGYFGTNNSECLCHTCEVEMSNGWRQASTSTELCSSEPTPDSSSSMGVSSYALRKKKRKDDAHSHHGLKRTLSTSSSSPKRQKLSRPPSRLNQVLTPPPSLQSPDIEPTPPLAGPVDEAVAGMTAATPHQDHGLVLLGPELNVVAGDNNFLPEVKPPSDQHLKLIDQLTSAAELDPLGPSLVDGIAAEQVQDPGVPLEPIDSVLTQSRSSVAGDEPATCQAPRSLVIPKFETVSALEAVSLTPNTAEDDNLKGENALVAIEYPPCQDGPSSGIVPENHDYNIAPSIEDLTTPAPSVSAPPSMLDQPSSNSDQTLSVRVPGDYILTRRLLAQPFDRWVRCQTCSGYFVQSNSYQTRRECPRCERHSMLYGFGWPKTEPNAKRLREIREMKDKTSGAAGKRSAAAVSSIVRGINRSDQRVGRGHRRISGLGRSGKSGKGSWVEGGGEEEREERVMDHRTVNRFIAPEDERLVRRRGRDPILDRANGLAAASSPADISCAEFDGCSSIGQLHRHSSHSKDYGGDHDISMPSLDDERARTTSPRQSTLLGVASRGHVFISDEESTGIAITAHNPDHLRRGGSDDHVSTLQDPETGGAMPRRSKRYFAAESRYVRD